MTSYEDRFDQIYTDGWSHDNKAEFQNLLLNVYPYSVKIGLPPNGRWLELGVGSGRVVDYNRRKLNSSYQVIGLDYNLSSLKICDRHLDPAIPLVRGDIRNIPFKPESFDLITLFGPLYALPKEHWFQTLAHLLTYLKKDGRLGFGVHPFNLLEILRCYKYLTDLKKSVTKSYLIKHLNQIGFETRYTIEKHHLNLILIKILQLAGRKLPNWFGFTELPNTSRLHAISNIMRKVMPPLTMGHYWVWIEK